jgi:hypothetical protein
MQNTTVEQKARTVAGEVAPAPAELSEAIAKGTATVGPALATGSEPAAILAVENRETPASPVAERDKEPVRSMRQVVWAVPQRWRPAVTEPSKGVTEPPKPVGSDLKSGVEGSATPPATPRPITPVK